MAAESILLIVIQSALTMYAVFGGADFGAGVWEFNTAFRTTEKERRLIDSAIGPVWEANHVWLIFVIVLTANAFPVALAAISRALWIPLLLALVGIVFRGSAFAFRSYSIGAPRRERASDIAFALASTLSPFFLGAGVGAIATGQLAVTSEGQFVGDPVWDWLSVPSAFTAFFAVGMCTYLAAFYLTREAAQLDDPELVSRWQKRSLLTGIAMGFLSIAGLVVVSFTAPLLWDGFRDRSWPLVLLSVAAGMASLVAMWNSQFTAAAVAAAATVAAVIWGWGVAQYPLLVPPSLSIEAARAPANVIQLALIVVAAGTSLLLPALAYLLLLFKAASRR